MNFDDFSRIAQLIVFAVSLPSLRDDLYKHTTHRWIRNVRHAGAIGFDVELVLSVLAELFLLHVLEIDAGVFDGNVLIAARDLDAQSLDGWSGLGGICGHL